MEANCREGRRQAGCRQCSSWQPQTSTPTCPSSPPTATHLDLLRRHDILVVPHPALPKLVPARRKQASLAVSRQGVPPAAGDDRHLLDCLNTLGHILITAGRKAGNGQASSRSKSGSTTETLSVNTAEGYTG
jgi:hypothetical protein